MARQIDYRSLSEYSADEVYATMVDPDYLRARLERLGGPGAALLEHSTDADGASYRLRHGLDNAVLPSLVQSLVPGDLVIERHETVRRVAAGDYRGDITVQIIGTPATAAGRMRLRDAEKSSEYVVQADVSVRVPLIGGRIEGMLAEQVHKLLTAEVAFTRDWLAGRSA